MVQFVIYLILVAFYIISYHLLRKYDNSERRLVFVGIWAVCLLSMIIYPFFLPKWWKLIILFSAFVFYASLFIGAEHEKSWTASGSKWSHFFIIKKVPQMRDFHIFNNYFSKESISFWVASISFLIFFTISSLHLSSNFFLNSFNFARLFFNHWSFSFLWASSYSIFWSSSS